VGVEPAFRLILDSMRLGRSTRSARRCLPGIVHFVLVFALSAPAFPVSNSGLNEFRELPLKLRSIGIRDVGLADVNADGLTDIFTVNHSELENVLVGASDGTFFQRIEQFGLTHNPSFPHAFYAGRSVPPAPKKRVNIAWIQGEDPYHLLIRVPDDLVRVSVRIWSRVRVEAPATVEIFKDVRAFPGGVVRTRINLRSSSRGAVRLYIKEAGIPIRFSFATSPGVTVGIPGRVAPDSFLLHRRDRHAAAWADVAGDRRPEAVFVRGGLVGRAALFPVPLYQELRICGRAGCPDHGPRLGLDHFACSSNSTEWVDANGDGALDLWVTCNRNQPPRLFIQGRGGFRERAATYGLGEVIDPGVWVDFDGDGDVDILQVKYGWVNVYRNTGKKFVLERLMQVPARILLDLVPIPVGPHLAVAAIARSGSGIVTFEPAGPTWTSFETIGLPASALAASWVDYDNDGDLDAHILPGGLFLQNAGTFNLAPRQPPAAQPSIVAARAAWFDVDGDGLQDVLTAYRQTFDRNDWDVRLSQNQGAHVNHWLDVQVVGPTGNRSGIGTKVTVTSSLGEQRSWVGAFEPSRHSQGYYRIHFGLGPVEQQLDVKVKWPDGTSSEIQTSNLNRVLVVQYGDVA
jgi:hypothetical protein